MNIFFLDKNPQVAAKMHCNKHVVKMILETAQLLSTAHRILDGELYIDSSSGRKIKRWKLDSSRGTSLYKATHINHPSSQWVRESSENYKWLFRLFVNLCDEYTFRYNKQHKTELLKYHLIHLPDNIPEGQFTEPPQAMPGYCKVQGDSVQAYRNYYINEKSRMLQYTNRELPEFIKLALN